MGIMVLHTLGLRRVINGATGKVEDEYYYYPFGGHFGECTSTAISQKKGMHVSSAHRFGGKEVVGAHAMSFLDFPARPYDAFLCQFWTDDPLREKYYGFGPRLYCMGNPISLTDPSGLKPSKEEAARMAARVYGDNVDLIGGWRESEIKSFNANNSSGLSTMLFERSIDNETTEYALAFAGSTDLKDFLNDFAQVIGFSPHYYEAMEIANDFKNNNDNNSEITYVGHSLGGGLSAACAYSTAGQAITFNAAGVSGSTVYHDPKANIDAYVTINDPLNIIQNHPILLPNVDGNIYYCLPNSFDPMSGHSISNFYGDSLERKLMNFYRKAEKRIINTIVNAIF